MKGNYSEDTFTENDVLACLEAAGLKHGRSGGRYILSQCPLHEDKNPSAQIYTDDWFVKCHAGCEGGRFHITKAFPELRSTDNELKQANANRPRRTQKEEQPVKYSDYEQRNEWLAMETIPQDHQFKGIPIEILHDMGWRWLPDKHSYYIPYFDKSKHYIAFSQMRHLQGERRFTFLKDAKPIAYGLWNLDNSKLFLVEGASDAAVMEYCAVPWIAVPSAASGELVGRLAAFCAKNDIELVYAGDNDSAGDKVREALDLAGHGYRVKQPPKIHKDWGDFFEAQGQEMVQEYCFEELFQKEAPETDIERVQAVFPGAKVLKVVGSEEKIVRSENPGEPTALF